MATKKSPLDRGLYSRETAAGETVHDVRLRIKGKLKIVGSGFPTKTAARNHRDRVRTEIRDGVYSPETFRRRRESSVTVSQVVALVAADYRRNARKSLRDLLNLQSFWQEQAGETPVLTVTGNMLTAWADQWLATGTSAARVNRRMSALLRGFRLARDADPPLVKQIPKWHALKEAAPRSGFVELDVYEQLRAAFPRYIQIPLCIGFWTGMRFGEICAISWPQVTFDHAEQKVHIRLSGSLTKNGRPRQVIMPGELYHTLAAWQEESKRDYPLCRWVCHRRGRRISGIRKMWQSVCVQLGLGTGEWMKKQGGYRRYQGLLVHDLRRSGIRNLIRSGVDRDTAKAISGHRTDDVFSRYNIVNEDDLAQAGTKVVAFLDKKMSEKVSQKVSHVVSA